MFNVDDWLDNVIKPEFSEEVPVCTDAHGSDEACYIPPDPYRHISSRDWSGTLRILVLCIGAQAAVTALAVVWDVTHYLVWRLRKKGKLIETSEKYTYLSILFDTMDVGMSIACCITFVLRAYASFEEGSYSEHRQKASDYIDFIASGLFGIRFIDGWLRANSRMAYTLRLQALLDVFTITSAIAVPLLRESWLPFTFLRPISMTQALSRLMRITDLPELYEQLALTLAEFFSMVFTFAGIIFIIENLGNPPGWTDGEDQNLSFMSAIWFVTVTVSTVGYGDFYPTSILGQVAGVVFIVIGVIFFGSKTSAIASLMSAAANGLGRYSSGRKPHVLLTGHVQSESLNDFSVEFFHREHAGHSKADYPVCILAKKLVNLEPLRLSNAVPYDRLQQLTGSVLKPPDLERCKIHSAKACFLLGDALALDQEAHDREILLRALAVKRMNPKIEIYLQLNRAASLPLAIAMTAISMSTLKCGLLAKTAVCPGIIPLIGNLMRSIDSKSVKKYAKKKKALGIQPEYLKGMESEIYRCTIPESLRGRKFGDLVQEVYNYRHKGLLLFALSVDGSVAGSSHDVIAPPGSPSPNMRSVAPSRAEAGDAKMVLLHPGKDYVVYEPYCMIIAADDPQNSLNRIGGVGLGDIVNLRRTKRTSFIQHASNQVVPANGESFGLPSSPIIVTESGLPMLDSEEDEAASEEEEQEGEEEGAGAGQLGEVSLSIGGGRFGSEEQEAAHSPAAVRLPGALGLVTSPMVGGGNSVSLAGRIAEADALSKKIGGVKPLPPVVEGKKKRRKVKKANGETPPKPAGAKAAEAHGNSVVSVEEKHAKTPTMALGLEEREDMLKQMAPPQQQLMRCVDLENHIVVCGFPPDVGAFLRPIRSAARQHKVSILFVHEDEPSNEQLRQIFPANTPQQPNPWSAFEVYLLQAPPLHPSSMRRANVGRAARVLLLAEMSNTEAEEPGLMDAAVVFAHRFVAQEYPGTAAKIASELRWDESIGFLDDAIRSDNAVAPLYLQPSFAEGSIYSAAMSTSMLVQAYYNPHLLSIVGKLLSTRITNDTSDDTSRGLAPCSTGAELTAGRGCWSGGGGVEASLIGGVAAVCCRLLLWSQDGSQHLPSWRAQAAEVELEQEDVNAAFEGRAYSELLRSYMQEKDLVPLGLYRRDYETQRWYTFTNPPPETKVRNDDKVFVLARRKPM